MFLKELKPIKESLYIDIVVDAQLLVELGLILKRTAAENLVTLLKLYY